MKNIHSTICVALIATGKQFISIKTSASIKSTIFLKAKSDAFVLSHLKFVFNFFFFEIFKCQLVQKSKLSCMIELQSMCRTINKKNICFLYKNLSLLSIFPMAYVATSSPVIASSRIHPRLLNF